MVTSHAPTASPPNFDAHTLPYRRRKVQRARGFGNSRGCIRGRGEMEHMVNEVATKSLPPRIVPHDVGQSQLPVFDLASGFQPSPLLSPGIIRRCVDGFFAHKYPIMPILDREQVYATLPHLHNLPEQYGLISALCAMIILQPEILGPPGPEEEPIVAAQLPSSELFINETRRSRQYCNHVELPCLATVHTSFFLFAALFSMGKDNSAWFYIREAMTMLQLQRFHEEESYSAMADLQHAIFCRRTFWLLFITERAYALQRHRPLTLQRTIDLPTVSPGPEATILSGFLDLVSLFQNFDDTFLSLWNLSSAASAASPQSLIRLQDILKFAIPNVSDRTEIQQADLLVSRQWLKTMVWQLCVSKGLLSSSPANESMSFHYPVTIARDVVLVSRLLPPEAFEANGVGILEKVFDIGCSLADVLLLHPGQMQVSSLEIGPRDYLMELVRVLGTVLGGTSKYLRLLAAKADECLHVRIGASLADSESSNDSPIIEEILDEDEEENFTKGVNEPMIYDQGSLNGAWMEDMAALGSLGIELENPPPYDLSEVHRISTIGMGNEQHNLSSPLRTPEWDHGFEANMGPNNGFA